MDACILEIPRDCYPNFLHRLDDSSRANLLATCKLFQKVVVDFEKPHWVDFLAKRKFKGLNVKNPRTKALAYLKAYCHFFYKYPEVRKTFETFPQAIFMAKQEIDRIPVLDIISLGIFELSCPLLVRCVRQGGCL